MVSGNSIDLKYMLKQEPKNEEAKKGHGGCGHNQPLVRKEGLKLFVQYKKAKDEDDVSAMP